LLFDKEKVLSKSVWLKEGLFCKNKEVLSAITAYSPEARIHEPLARLRP
jgi:hypothetical protein